MNVLNSLFIFGLMYIHQAFYCLALLYAIVNGNLSTNWDFFNSIFVYELKSTILYFIDSKGSQMGIYTSRDDNHKYRFNFIFNQIHEDIPLLRLCGCNSCENTMIDFHIRSYNGTIGITCNNRTSRTMFIKDLYKNITKKRNTVYQTPNEILSSNNKMYLMIGNYGPYAISKNKYVFPIHHELVGCLYQFTYNNKRIIFKSNDFKIRPSCPVLCQDNICNGGTCRGTLYGIKCDCRNTPFNGLYCNKSLALYSDSSGHSYQKINDSPDIYFKFTWKSLLSKKYCLLDISNSNMRFAITIKNNDLLLNSKKIGDVGERFNFINVNISNNNMIIKIKKIDVIRKFIFDEGTVINVGLSRNNSECVTFEGAYDFNIYSSLKLIWTRKPSSIYATSLVYQTSPKNNITSIKAIDSDKKIYGLIFMVVLVAISFLFSMYYFINRQLRKHFESIHAIIARSEDLQGTGPGIYGQVEDSSNYDYI